MHPWIMWDCMMTAVCPGRRGGGGRRSGPLSGVSGSEGARQQPGGSR